MQLLQIVNQQSSFVDLLRVIFFHSIIFCILQLSCVTYKACSKLAIKRRFSVDE
jgi:hypothetical protein